MHVSHALVCMTVIVSRNTVGTILLAQLLEEVQLLALLVCSLGYTIATGGGRTGWWLKSLHKVYSCCRSNIP